MDIKDILTERGKTHGKWSDHAFITQQLMAHIMRGVTNRDIRMSASQHEGLHMICHKLGRIAAGDPSHIDHWDDIAGYAKLVADELRKQQAEMDAFDIRFGADNEG